MGLIWDPFRFIHKPMFDFVQYLSPSLNRNIFPFLILTVFPLLCVLIKKHVPIYHFFSTSNEDRRGFWKHGVGTMNEIGKLFVELCGDHSLKIRGALLPHKECHKNTWYSKDHDTLEGRRWTKTLLDNRALRGADVGSDHHLMYTFLHLIFARTSCQIIKIHTQAKKITSWAGLLGLFSSNWAKDRISAYVGTFFIHISKIWASWLNFGFFT